MAGVTRRARKVIRSGHLREIARFGRIFLMAADAECGHIGKGRLAGGRVAAVGVRGLRPVACLAGNVSVLTGGTRLSFVGVAQDALRLPREGHGPRADQIQGSGPIVAVAAKALGDDSLANYQENCEPRQQDERRPHEMTGIPKKSAHMPKVVHGRGQY